MHFVGLDLAWGEKNSTGIAVVDSDGRLLHIGAAQDDASIEAAVEPYVSGDCIVAIDAPLIVRNPTGSRPCETALNRDFHRFEAGAHPANTENPAFKNPRGARIATALTLDMNPASSSPRRAIEVYPHPATVVLFGLAKTLKYKKGAFEARQGELLRLMTMIEGLDGATPRLRVNHNVSWVELRKRVAAATRPGQLDRDEDPVDAVVCAYVALYRYHRPEDVTIYGDFTTGYIVTPTLPRFDTRAPSSPRPTTGHGGTTGRARTRRCASRRSAALVDRDSPTARRLARGSANRRDVVPGPLHGPRRRRAVLTQHQHRNVDHREHRQQQKRGGAAQHRDGVATGENRDVEDHRERDRRGEQNRYPRRTRVRLTAPSGGGNTR